MTHCHIFLPIVDARGHEGFNVTLKMPALISCIVAVAARFHHGYTSRIYLHEPSESILGRSLSQSLATLAENHMSDILLQKVHSLPDMQAILLLAGWGLRSGGDGPDAWILSGHAARVGTRLGLNRLGAKNLSIENTTDDDEVRKAARLESVMRRWRTWLCWSW